MKNKKIFILTLAIISLLTVGCVKNNEKTPTEEEKTQLVYCSECGQESLEVSKYCSNCGELAKWTAEKKEAKTDEKSQDDESSKTNENSEATQNNTQTTINRKAEYINRLNQVEESMSDLEELYAGSTIEMKDAAGQSYERWDNILNEIYSLLRQQLSTSVADDLKNKQIEWIKYRDKKAENDASEYTGGTMYGLIYVDSLGQITKERCYELVNTYMK